MMTGVLRQILTETDSLGPHTAPMSSDASVWGSRWVRILTRIGWSGSQICDWRRMKGIAIIIERVQSAGIRQV